MKKLLLISFASLLFFSCKTYHGPVSGTEDFTKGVFNIQNAYFATIGEEHIFRAHIQVFKKEVSGLLVVKRIDEQLHRVVLTSDFGNTLFDFSLYQNAPYQVNYVMPDLNKKMLLNFLAQDFGLLVAEQHVLDAKKQEEQATIYRGKHKNKRLFVVVAQGNVTDVIVAKTSKPKIVFTYPTMQRSSVVIKHQNLPLEISLTPLEIK